MEELMLCTHEGLKISLRNQTFLNRLTLWEYNKLKSESYKLYSEYREKIDSLEKVEAEKYKQKLDLMKKTIDEDDKDDFLPEPEEESFQLSNEKVISAWLSFGANEQMIAHLILEEKKKQEEKKKEREEDKKRLDALFTNEQLLPSWLLLSKKLNLYQLGDLVFEDSKSITFDQSFDKFKGEEITALALLIAANKTLNAIDFSYNFKVSQGTTLLSDMLKKNTNITSVNFSNNAISREAIIVFATAFKTNTSIISLSFSSVNIGREGALALVEMLKVNKNITSLYFGKNNINDADLETTIDSLLQENRKIQNARINWGRVSTLLAFQRHNDVLKDSILALMPTITKFSENINNNDVNEQINKSCKEGSQVNSMVSDKQAMKFSLLHLDSFLHTQFAKSHIEPKK